jgi:hypothetical protein
MHHLGVFRWCRPGVFFFFNQQIKGPTRALDFPSTAIVYCFNKWCITDGKTYRTGKLIELPAHVVGQWRCHRPCARGVRPAPSTKARAVDPIDGGDGLSIAASPPDPSAVSVSNSNRRRSGLAVMVAGGNRPVEASFGRTPKSERSNKNLFCD